MPAARCYECPNCGGLVRETERLCPYCSSPVATVRCGRCFMLNVTEAAHCIGCGAALGLTSVSQSVSVSWACPRCRPHPLDAFANEDGVLYDCARCGGQFVSHEVLVALIKRHQAVDLSLPRRLNPHRPAPEPVIYLPCPACGCLMQRQNFGRLSGIIVDNCTSHGSWFDVGELPRILAFVAQGGLQRSSKVASASLPAQISSLRTAELDCWSPNPDPLEALSLDDLLRAARSFVSWAKEMLR